MPVQLSHGIVPNRTVRDCAFATSAVDATLAHFMSHACGPSVAAQWLRNAKTLMTLCTGSVCLVRPDSTLAAMALERLAGWVTASQQSSFDKNWCELSCHAAHLFGAV